MKGEDYTYHPVSASVLAESFRNLLFGSLSATRLCQDYHHLKPLVLEFLSAGFHSPGYYAQKRSELPDLVKMMLPDDQGQIPEIWDSPFYRYEDSELNAFHPLCEFYQKFVYRECRMLIIYAELWRRDDQVSTRRLKYELGAVSELLSVFIRLCYERDLPEKETGGKLEERLRKYLARLLMYELGSVLFELSVRFHSLFDSGRISSPEAFYIHILNHTVPDPIPFYGTRFLIVHELSRMTYNRNVVSKLKALRSVLHTPVCLQSEKVHQEQQAGNALIDNIGVSYYILKALDGKDDQFSELHHDPASAEELLKQWRINIQEGKEGKVEVATARYLDKIHAVLGVSMNSEAPSEAVLLLRAIAQQGVPLEDPEQRTTGPVVNATDTPGDGKHPLLADLVSIDELRERLQISMVTLNKYLNDSGIPVIRFSAKSRWLRPKDYQKFLDYFTTEGTD